MDSLTALSPIDGRYRPKTEELTGFFSEFALIRYRIRVEIGYFRALCAYPLPELADFDPAHFPALEKIYRDFGPEDARAVKAIEKTTNHDVKAVEYFLKEKFAEMGLGPYAEFIHFGLTSQDINNTAIPLSLKEASEDCLLPAWEALAERIEVLAERWDKVPMLAFTHGQPASPTRMGKELRVFSYRLREQLRVLRDIPFSAKFGGATGNFNAHCVAYPEVDWPAFAKDFVEGALGLRRAVHTTQIENYDHLAGRFDAHRRLGTILIDLARDLWQYISMGYFRQKIKEGEIGSSAMPHKVNPIDFENAEGNLGIARALHGHFSEKLPISRLQRDLSDSTVLRNLGVPFGHELVALKSMAKGLGKLELDEGRLRRDLEDNWVVVAEAIQTVLRRKGYPQPYEALKALTRGQQKINAESIRNFIDSLDTDADTKAALKKITPFNYTGHA